MKRIICCLLTGTLCVLTLGGFGNQNINAQTNETDNLEQAVDVLKEMEAVNETDVLQARYGKVAYRHTDYYADDSERSIYYYKDQERWVLESDGYVMINEAGDVYGYDEEEEKAFRSLFVGDTYEEFYSEWNYLVGYQYDGENETVLTKITENGVIDIDTEITDKELVNEDIVHLGYEEDSVKKILYCYELEEETYVINKYTTTAVFADGTQKILSEIVRVEDVETYVPDEQLIQLINGEDKRTVTIIAHPGTENEQIYSKTITKGNMIQVLLPADGEQVTYSDAACTMEYVGSADLNADITVYYK